MRFLWAVTSAPSTKQSFTRLDPYTLACLKKKKCWKLKVLGPTRMRSPYACRATSALLGLGTHLGQAIPRLWLLSKQSPACDYYLSDALIIPALSRLVLEVGGGGGDRGAVESRCHSLHVEYVHVINCAPALKGACLPLVPAAIAPGQQRCRRGPRTCSGEATD